MLVLWPLHDWCEYAGVCRGKTIFGEGHQISRGSSNGFASSHFYWKQGQCFSKVWHQWLLSANARGLLFIPVQNDFSLLSFQGWDCIALLCIRRLKRKSLLSYGTFPATLQLQNLLSSIRSLSTIVFPWHGQLWFILTQVEYLQTVLEGYLSTQAYELAGNFRAALLEKVMETVAEMTDQQNHGRGSLRGGSQDGYDYGGMTAEDLQVTLQPFRILLAPRNLTLLHTRSQKLNH